MQYEIEAGGRLRHVTVRRTGDGFALSVDGRLHQVDAVRIDTQTLSLIVDSGVSARPQDVPAGPQDPPHTGGPGLIRLRPRAVYGGRPGLIRPGSSFETTVVPEAGTGRLVVRVGSVAVAVTLNGRRRGGGRESGAPGPLRVAAPMPGKVVRVLVKAGDPVHARQPVVVVEAMKMENELRADRDGTVVEVHAREGMSVEAGALLVVIQ